MGAVTDILQTLTDRRVLVVGLARSGLAAARVLAGRGAQVTGTDRKAQVDGAGELEAAGVRLALGADAPELARAAELVVLSPGVPATSPLVAAAGTAGVPVIGELELAFRLAAVPTLAVTGTNGKSTTTALCAHLLERAGKRVFLGGNIGRPLSELLLVDAAERSQLDWAVVEVSSFQLEHLSAAKGFAPRIGVWLNLTPDHLDRHGDLATYAATKRRMFEGLGADDLGVVFLDDELVRGATEGLACRRAGFGRAPARLGDGDALIEGARVQLVGRTLRLGNPRLAGDHNAENAAAALLAVTAAGAPLDGLQAALDDFAGLPDRIEPVRELAGVRWINDSKGTNPDATAKSLTGFPGGVVLIAGGRGKGTDYRKLREVVTGRVAHLILLGEDADRLAADLDGCAPIRRVADMAEAVSAAADLARPGGVVLLSPACASFDMFDDYAHRGRVFRELVAGLEERS